MSVFDLRVETGRLLLRPPRIEDFDGYAELLGDEDAALDQRVEQLLDEERVTARTRGDLLDQLIDAGAAGPELLATARRALLGFALFLYLFLFSRIE